MDHPSERATQAEAADYLSKDIRTLQRWAAKDPPRGPQAHRAGNGRPYYLWAELDAFLAAGAAQNGAGT